MRYKLIETNELLSPPPFECDKLFTLAEHVIHKGLTLEETAILITQLKIQADKLEDENEK